MSPPATLKNVHFAYIGGGWFSGLLAGHQQGMARAGHHRGTLVARHGKGFSMTTCGNGQSAWLAGLTCRAHTQHVPRAQAARAARTGST